MADFEHDPAAAYHPADPFAKPAEDLKAVYTAVEGHTGIEPAHLRFDGAKLSGAQIGRIRH